MVEVFRTNVLEKLMAEKLIKELNDIFPSAQINFDLDDCDHILRIKSESVCVDAIKKLLSARGFMCEIID